MKMTSGRSRRIARDESERNRKREERRYKQIARILARAAKEKDCHSSRLFFNPWRIGEP